MKRLIGLIILGMVLAMSAKLAFAANQDPEPADTITKGDSSRYVGQATGFLITAEAGNVSALEVTDTRITRYWQGYYGNITGTITLDDSSNNTLFHWQLATPSGEIYAVNTSGSVSWDNVTCVNFTSNTNYSGNATGDKINKSTLHGVFGITNDTWADTFEKTFNNTYNDQLVVGPKTIAANSRCPLIYTFVDEAYQQTSFREVLLYDNVSALVFAAILENGVDGFRSSAADTHDFQMVVAEDGSPGGPDTSTTNYYFYVELN